MIAQVVHDQRMHAFALLVGGLVPTLVLTWELEYLRSGS
mgnify:CR=1 FL=1